MAGCNARQEAVHRLRQALHRLHGRRCLRCVREGSWFACLRLVSSLRTVGQAPIGCPRKTHGCRSVSLMFGNELEATRTHIECSLYDAVPN